MNAGVGADVRKPVPRPTRAGDERSPVEVEEPDLHPSRQPALGAERRDVDRPVLSECLCDPLVHPVRLRRGRRAAPESLRTPAIHPLPWRDAPASPRSCSVSRCSWSRIVVDGDGRLDGADAHRRVREREVVHRRDRLGRRPGIAGRRGARRRHGARRLVGRRRRASAPAGTRPRSHHSSRRPPTPRS